MNIERSLKTNASITHTKKNRIKNPRRHTRVQLNSLRPNTHKPTKFAMSEMPRLCSHRGRRIVGPNYHPLSQLWMATTFFKPRSFRKRKKRECFDYSQHNSYLNVIGIEYLLISKRKHAPNQKFSCLFKCPLIRVQTDTKHSAYTYCLSPHLSSLGEPQ